MNFSKVLTELSGRLDAAGIRYALIGGFAMALRGVQRATMDLDFLLMLDDLDKAHAIFGELGYRRGRAIDWPLVEDYLRLFQLEHKLPELKSAYGPLE
ncbi:MAG: hypothetical protein EXS37_21060 [Opitutus sp.]|nr:hypothetical protein [Opitutus sp.]MSU51545.1 hypothetical protein [Opitutus sp.]